MKTIKAVATITEHPEGWVWEENDRMYKTAWATMQAIKRHDRETAKNGVTTIRTISWNCMTRAGWHVAKSFAQ